MFTEIYNKIFDRLAEKIQDKDYSLHLKIQTSTPYNTFLRFKFTMLYKTEEEHSLYQFEEGLGKHNYFADVNVFTSVGDLAELGVDVPQLSANLLARADALEQRLQKKGRIYTPSGELLTPTKNKILLLPTLSFSVQFENLPEPQGFLVTDSSFIHIRSRH